MLGTISGALARSLICIYPITLNGYIYSPGKKIEKIKKNRKNLKKLKIIGTISGALARSLIFREDAFVSYIKLSVVSVK